MLWVFVCLVVGVVKSQEFDVNRLLKDKYQENQLRRTMPLDQQLMPKSMLTGDEQTPSAVAVCFTGNFPIKDEKIVSEIGIKTPAQRSAIRQGYYI